MTYKIAVDNRPYGSTRVSGGSSDPLCEACLLLSSSGLDLIPINKRTGDIAPSDSLFDDYEDTAEYIWVPFPYRNFDLRRVDKDAECRDRRNLYNDILTGVLTKANLPTADILPDDKEYITKHFDQYIPSFIKICMYAYMSENNLALEDSTVNTVVSLLSGKFDKLPSMSEGELKIELKDIISKTLQSTSQPEPQTTPNGKASKPTPTSQVIQNLVGGSSQPMVKKFPTERVPVQSQTGVVVPNGDGTVTVNFSNLPTQPEAPATTAQVQETTVPLVTAPAGDPNPPVMVQTPVTPPLVGAAPRETVAPTTRTTKAKSDVVDNPPQTTVVPETSKVDPLADVQETESDKLLEKYPQLQLYKKCVGDQFNCEFFLNGKLVSVRVRDKNATANDPDIVTLGATFDVAGAIISPETNKFWAGNDPDIIYDFELPLKLTEDVVRAYLNDEEFNEDMYYSNSSVCELNKQFNIRSIWEFVSDGDQATQTMQHLKKVFGLPKFKQVRKKLTGRRLSMDSFTDPTHFVLMTHPGTPDYLGGTKVNEGKTIFKLTVNGDDMKLEPVKDVA